MTTKERLHQLVDQLPDRDVGTAARLLEALRDTSDPVAELLDQAPVDDEPVTPDDEAAIREGWAGYRRGGGISSEEARRRLLS